MIVEVRWAETNNKGAELMLRAIVDRLPDDVDVCVDPRTGTYAERSRLGVLHKVADRRLPSIVIDTLGRCVPRPARRYLRRHFGLVFDVDLDCVLDASGFAYSDQFALDRCTAGAKIAARARRRKQKVILLPQAFGPFESAPHRRAFLTLASNSDLVYARETESLQHALAAGADPARISVKPDFTALLPGRGTVPRDPASRLALLVPSTKLLTHSVPEVRDAYVPFFTRVATQLLAARMDVRLLLHERGDAAVFEQLQAALDAPLPVLRSDDAQELKGMIKAADVLVGSRFHALVSALSQGVPAIAVGWSHKYEMLFGEYGHAENVIDPRIADNQLAALLDGVLSEPSRTAHRAGLLQHASTVRRDSGQMWQEILTTLRSD